LNFSDGERCYWQRVQIAGARDFVAMGKLPGF